MKLEKSVYGTEIKQHIYAQLILKKVAKGNSMKKEYSLINGAGTIRYPHKKANFNTYLTEI